MGAATALAATAAIPARATVFAPPALLPRAMAALNAHAGAIPVRDRIIIADYGSPSRSPRFDLVNVANGSFRSLLVSHGRGSDPDHNGWVDRFSNAPGSNASSEGAYAAAAEYVGKHGRSRRLIGLDPSNNNAEPRAIVVHSAWYVSPDMVRQHGKLGRSEGCFAVSEQDLASVMDWLTPGTLLFSGKA